MEQTPIATDMQAPMAQELYERALLSLPGGNARSTLFVAPHPPYAARGEGCEVLDVDGHRAIDLQNNYTALVHGHAFAPVARAAMAALAQGSAFGLPTLSEVELAECLAARVGWAERWRFANSGTEAVMMAVRAARAATGRDGLLRFANCYHGSWDAVVRRGSHGVPAAAQHDVLTLELGDEQAFVGALEEHAGRIAAVLLDPMPNRAGLRPLEPSFVRLVRDQTERHGIALVLDEVITFRLAPGGLHTLYGIEGDLIALGKMIGGGFPVGAVGGRGGFMDVFDPRRPDAVAHGGTFSANPVTMRAGLAALEAFGSAEIDRVNALGERLRVGLRERGWSVSGQGSLLQIQAQDPTALWWRLYEAGVLIAGNGLMCISTPMDWQTIEKTLLAFDQVGDAAR
ncbi:MAG TPA: aminotransferase class III-fold pyridoxal phosphate-dependent enzyme [Solirubrobacteraceae bacterium]|jgi:glutamate-1-semialdehyde 2,1-aminomutase|nr:aminotransferase class III-fold pyridoxal phosphate-dependent enzyme [Solirubrobacteraceae bacterium]